MTSLTVWLYPTPFAADAAEVRLKRLAETGNISVHDVVMVVWPRDDQHPRVSHWSGRHHDVLEGARARLHDVIVPGTSAMFVLSSGANAAAVREVIDRDPEARLVHAETDDAAVQSLLEEFSDGDGPAPDRPSDARATPPADGAG